MTLRDFDDQLIVYHGGDPLRRFRFSAEGQEPGQARVIDMSAPTMFDGWFSAFTDFTVAAQGIPQATNGAFQDQLVGGAGRAPQASGAFANRPGIMRCTSAAAANSGVSIHVPGLPVIGGEAVACSFLVPGALTNVQNTVGITNDGGTVTEPATGCYWWLTGGTMTPKNAVGGVRTTGSSVVIAADVWYTAYVRVTDDKSGCLYRLYNSDTGVLLSEQTLTGNMPTTGGFSFGCKAATSGAAAINCGDFDTLFIRWKHESTKFTRYICTPQELYT